MSDKVKQLGIFAKYWQPGRVKTRLAADIGDVAASEIYRGFVVVLLARLGGQADRCLLCYTPSEKIEPFQEIAGDWQLAPQSDGDLGTRMRAYFDEAFSTGFDRVILLGSDSPNVPLEFVEQAFTSLNNHDVTLGPTPDGGYYLVGARKVTPNIFDGVDWSTPQVWEQTLANIQRENLTHAILPTWYDVDDVDDLQRLRGELDDESDASLTQLRKTIDQSFNEPGAAAPG